MWSYQHGHYAEKMVRAAKEVHGAHIVQMTDLTTPPVPGVDEVIRHAPDVPLMVFRLRHLATYHHEEMLILDSDVICKAPCPEVWAQDFDVALTRRAGDDMPYNTGVMFSRSIDFWQEALEFLLRRCKPKHQDWYGDQLAVVGVANTRHYHVLDLPCDLYNWTPENREEQSDAKFVHYKGQRKEWI
jgi:hypothetical protein